jgi:NAD-dependent deacetylase
VIVTASNLTNQIPADLGASLRSAHHIAVLTGSGISAESGVPTFRDAQTGLWSKYDPQSLATPEAFENDPKLVWDWYRWRRELIGKARPNPGHLALVEMEIIVPKFSLITQNVDGLHRLAGSSDPVEIHGNIMRSKCTKEGVLVEEAENAAGELPRCPDCGSLLRPDVVWFGEMVPPVNFDRAFKASRTCDVFMSIGTSGVVQPAASLSLESRNAGAFTVEINIEDTPTTPYFDIALRGSAAKILPQLVDLIKKG